MISAYLIPIDRFDDPDYIESRVTTVEPAAAGAMRTALRYLYLIEGPINLPRGRRGKTVTLFRACDLRIRRHIKVQAVATLYDPAYEAYFEERRVLQRNGRQRDYYRWLDRKQLELEWVA